MSAERGRRWAVAHRKKADPSVTKARARRFEARCTSAGIETSNAVRSSIVVDMGKSIDSDWLIRVAVPFTYSASKNAVYSLGKNGGHIFKRQLNSQFRNAVTLALQAALARSQQKVFQNKVWLDIFVQKADHKGDAVNVLDTVCDAVKDAIGVDDRWFAIRRLDWEICKTEPRIFIGLTQADCFDARMCSCCGRGLPLDQFTKNKRDKLGVGRTCRDCRTATPYASARLPAEAESA